MFVDSISSDWRRTQARRVVSIWGGPHARKALERRLSVAYGVSVCLGIHDAASLRQDTHEP
jgi:hypothetical protein